MGLHNTKPRPDALFIGFNNDELKKPKLTSIFPTNLILEDMLNLVDYSQGEYDVAIVTKQKELTSLQEIYM